jgi:hypothetical protein
MQYVLIMYAQTHRWPVTSFPHLSQVHHLEKVTFSADGCQTRRVLAVKLTTTNSFWGGAFVFN